MTRYEAIKVLERLKIASKACGSTSDDRTYDKAVEALNLAIAALRGPTREQVEKAWKGEWINKHSAYDHKIFICAQCGKHISIQGKNLDFCPKCGSAQTDEAVDIVMERLEALKDGSTGRT